MPEIKTSKLLPFFPYDHYLFISLFKSLFPNQQIWTIHLRNVSAQIYPTYYHSMEISEYVSERGNVMIWNWDATIMQEDGKQIERCKTRNIKGKTWKRLQEGCKIAKAFFCVSLCLFGGRGGGTRTPCYMKLIHATIYKYIIKRTWHAKILYQHELLKSE